MPRRPRFRALVFLGIVALVELFYGLWNPAYNNPDERSHLQCMAFYRDEGRMPDPYSESEKIQQDKHPPYTYVLGAAILKLTDGAFTAAGEWVLPGPYERRWELGHLQPARLAAKSPPVADGQLLVLRGVMALHWLLAAFFLLAIADFVRPDRPRFAFLLALGFVTIPQAAMSGAAVTPDTPLSAFSIATLAYLIRASSGQPLASGRRLGILAGLFWTLALLTKSAAIFLAPVVVIAIWLCARRAGRRVALQFALFAIGIPLVLAGWWYVRNMVLYGDPFQMRAQVEAYTHSIRRDPLTSTFFEVLVTDLFRTFFGFYQRDLLLPRPLLLFLAGIVGVACAGLALLARRPIREELHAREWAALPLAIVGFGTLLALTVIGNLTVPSAQGRYLYPALGCIMLLAGSGWTVALRIHRDSRFLYVLVAVWIVLGIWGFHWSLLRHESVNRARAFGGGGVIFYDDCGSLGLQSHCVQGLIGPDGGQLGRIVPWRTHNGHPSAIIYRYEIPAMRRHNLQVRVTYFNPDPSTPYVAYDKGHFVYATQTLSANGVKLHDAIEVTSTPRECVFPIPDRLIQGGSLELRFERVAGIAAVVSEIWIEQRWLVFDPESRVVRNRTEHDRMALVLWRKEGHRGLVELNVPASGSVPTPAAVPAAGASLQVLPRDESPWIVREAEAHPAGGNRWFGDMRASGGYAMRGTGVLASLPVGHEGGRTRLLLARQRARSGPWMLVPISGSARRVADDTVLFRGAALDYVQVSGVWRP